MGKIFCLMGKSGTGKDTVLKLLLQDNNLALKSVVSYTTRPIRTYEQHGREYFFLSERELEEFEIRGKIIEKRVYNTVDGLWYYCTIDDGQIDLKKGNFVLISTLDGYIKLSDYFGKENVESIYLKVDDGTRLQRALDREKSQDNPKYDELCRRFLADNEDFSEENLLNAGIKEFFLNDDLGKCLEKIIERLG